jgi:hypothetical protein
MESGDGYGGRKETQQPSDEVSLQPEWRRRTASAGIEQNLTLQPEWRRGRSTASPSPSGAGDEVQNKEEEKKEEILFQPQWRSSKVNASSVWEPEWRRSRSNTTATVTAYPWNQNYGVKKPVGSSSGGVQRGRNIDESRRNDPPLGIFSTFQSINK